MVLKLTVYVRNVIFFIYKPKNPREIPIFGTFYGESEILTFGNCNVITWMFVLILVLMERGDTKPYYGWLDISGGSVFKLTGDGNHPPNRKSLGKTRVKVLPHH